MSKQDSFLKRTFPTKLSVVYFILRVSVIGVLVLQLLNRNFSNVFLCVLTLVLFTLPSFVEKRLKINVPDTLEIIILLFIYAAEILGEIREFYLTFPYWDAMLHTLNGFLCAAIGLSFVNILNDDPKLPFQLSPFFVVLVGFCFSMTIGVLWEFFEYGMDVFTLSDMQKDTILHQISSVMLHPEGRNVAVTVPIESIVVNNKIWNGYIDIGLIDTMQDMLVNFIGAAVFSVIGYIYLKGKSRSGITDHLLLTKIEAEDRKREDAE